MRWLAQVEDVHFYGESLELEREDALAFGHRFFLDENRTKIRVRPRYKSLETNALGHGPRGGKYTRTINGGPQFRSVIQERAIARGYLCRFLDGANLPKEQIRNGLMRIVLELEQEGYESESLRVATRKIQSTTITDLKPVWECLQWTYAHK